MTQVLNTALRALLTAGVVAALAACAGGDGDTTPAGLASEPPLEVETAKLNDALLCTPFEHPGQPAVLLVHGTFTAGYEQYEWNYLPLLTERGFDVCVVTYPDRGLGDQQVAAEYVVHALRTMHARSGRKVAMIGHSQGATMPRWALKWWASAREAVDDFVLIAGPHHGTTVASPTALPALLGLSDVPAGLAPAGFFQFDPGSQFVAALNAGDETPGAISYSNLYTTFDELVQPVMPEPTAALEFGQGNPDVANLLLQDLCPARVVDHVTIGTTDQLAFALALDAISHPGPADFERAGGAALCASLPILPDPAALSGGAAALLDILQRDAAAGLPELHLSAAEPPLKPYAQ